MSEAFFDVLNWKWWLDHAIWLLLSYLLLFVAYQLLKFTIRKMSSLAYFRYMQFRENIDRDAENLVVSPALVVAVWLLFTLLWSLASLLALAAFAGGVSLGVADRSSNLTTWRAIGIGTTPITAIVGAILSCELARRMMVLFKAYGLAHTDPSRLLLRPAVEQARPAHESSTAEVSPKRSDGQAGPSTAGDTPPDVDGTERWPAKKAGPFPDDPGPSLTSSPLAKVVFPLHGIRTQARWQGAFADVAQSGGWKCKLADWYFGRFSLIQFLSPWSRDAKVNWFRLTYHNETKYEHLDLTRGEYPSVVAHSFGTYILGNALLKDQVPPVWQGDPVRLDLPRDFPWQQLIERGQVQCVRNEFGVRDVWARCVHWVIPQTGASGTTGFAGGSLHDQDLRFEQHRFLYRHSEYFEKGHMENYWLPFLDKALPFLPVPGEIEDVSMPAPTHPIVMYISCGSMVGVLAFLVSRILLR